MENALFKVLHDECHASDQLMQHWTAVNILGSRAQDLISLGEVRDLAEDV